MRIRTAALLVLAGYALAASVSVPQRAIPDGQSLPTALEAGWKGTKVCELLFENTAIRAARCTFPPGVGHERHFHPPHWVYVLHGATMRITDANGTRDRVFEPGTSQWSDGIAWHEAVNIGSTTSAYIIVEPKSSGSGSPHPR